MALVESSSSSSRALLWFAITLPFWIVHAPLSQLVPQIRFTIGEIVTDVAWLRQWCKLSAVTSRVVSLTLCAPSSPEHFCVHAPARRVSATARFAILLQRGAEVKVFALLVSTFTFWPELLARGSGLRKILGFSMDHFKFDPTHTGGAGVGGVGSLRLSSYLPLLPPAGPMPGLASP